MRPFDALPLFVIAYGLAAIKCDGVSLRETHSSDNLRLVQRAFALLELLSEGSKQIGEASRLTTLPKGTVHRIYRTLVNLGYVHQEIGGNYALTTKLFEVASRVVYSLDLRQTARSHLEQLAAETGETAHLGVLNGLTVVFVDKVESPVQRALGMTTRVGGKVMAHCSAIGKVLLADLPPEGLARFIDERDLVRFTSHTVSNIEELGMQLALVRRDGYAINYEEYDEGIVAVGAPVRNHSGKAIAGISLAAPTFRMPVDQMPDLALRVKQTAEEISRDLGCVLASRR